MVTQRELSAVLEQEYLPLRAKILELAAGLDRLDRAAGDAAADPRRRQLADGVTLLLDATAGRAERVQRLFSREYSAAWRAELGV